MIISVKKGGRYLIPEFRYVEIPVALPSSNRSTSQFYANWVYDASATGFRLDVADVSNFSSFVAGFNSRNVGNVSTYLVSGLTSDSSYYYRVRAYTNSMITDYSNVIEASTDVQTYTACATFKPYFPTISPSNGFLSAPALNSSYGTLGDYVIEWRVNSSNGETVFVSGVGADPSIQAQHPFNNEVVFAGNLYPIIKYLYVNSERYTLNHDRNYLYSPDFINCLAPIYVQTLDCSTVLGADPIYPYYLSYVNSTDFGANKSRTLKYTVCPSVQYLAWAFDGYTVSEQVKISYCTSTNSTGTLLDNFVHGVNGSTGHYLSTNLYPTNYPVNPRIYVRTYSTQDYYMRYVTRFDSSPYHVGDYLKIEIVGSVYDPSNNDTNWDLKLKSLYASDVSNYWLFDGSLSKYANNASINFVSTPGSCYYKLSYDTSAYGTPPSKAAPSAPFIWKYLDINTKYSTGPAGLNYSNPVISSLYWLTNTYYSLITQGNHSYTACTDLAPGQTITYSLQTADVSAFVVTCTDSSDYDKFVNNINYVKSSAQYAQSLASPDTSVQYYGHYDILVKNASSCGDSGSGYDYVYIWFGADVSWNPIAKTITFPIVNVSNHIVDVSCDNSYQQISSRIGQMAWTSTPSPAGRLPFGNVLPFVSKTRIPDPVAGYLPYNSGLYYTTLSTYYAYSINKIMLNNLVDLSPYLFFYDMSVGGAATQFTDSYTQFRYWDIFTLTNTVSASTRLNNYRLERKKFLRTDNSADTAFEIVHDVSG